MTARDEIRAFIEIIEIRLRLERERLIGEMRSLARSLEHNAKELEMRGDDALINCLGEVQGQGATIDTACARFASLKEALKILSEVTK